MTPEEKLQKFQEDIKRRHAVVFCVRCGSTAIDQNFRSELRCYDCGNTLLWDADRFSVARDISPDHDAASAFRSFEKQQLQHGEHDWHGGILKATQAFTDIVGTIPIYPEPSPQGRQDRLSSEDLRRLCEAWCDCRTRINALLEQLLTDDNSTVE